MSQGGTRGGASRSLRPLLLLMALGPVAAVACTGQLDYDVEEYRAGSQAAAPGSPPPSSPASGPPATTPPAAAPPASSPPQAGGAPAAPAPAPEARPPAAQPCAGLDALAILAQRCGACHGERTPTKGLDLISPGVGKRLVGVQSSCMGRPFLASNEAAGESLFVIKMDGPVAGCGGQMPFGAAPLSPEERACLVDWSEKAIARESGR